MTENIENTGNVDNQPSLRDRLLAADPAAPTARYRRQLDDLLRGKLSALQKAALVATTAFTLAASAWFTWLAARPAPPLPAAARGGFVFGAACCLVWAVYAMKTLRAGVFNRRRHVAVFLGIAAVVSLGTGILLIVLGLGQPDVLRVVRAGFMGIVCLIGAAQYLLQNVIEQSELRTRERLLELQLQVAELKESLGTCQAQRLPRSNLPAEGE